MARQIERANNIARILNVHQSFSRNAVGEQNWEAVLRLFDDHDRFLAEGREVGADTVLGFYLLDRRNPTSIPANIYFARENARILRHRLSTEIWFQINSFYNTIRGLTSSDVREERVSDLCDMIRTACQTHSGIVAETLYMDEAWYFSKTGMNLERADQVSRLLDSKYHLMLPEGDKVGTPVDISQWNMLLRSAAGYHAFRRIHPTGLTTAKIAGFLLFDKRFPRSVAGSVAEATRTLHGLRAEFGLSGGKAALDALQDFHRVLSEDSIDGVISDGLHEYLDFVQRTVIDVTNHLHRDFFAPAPEI